VLNTISHTFSNQFKYPWNKAFIASEKKIRESNVFNIISHIFFRFGADFLNMHGAVIPRVTSNAAFHNIFWSVTLHQADVSSAVTFCILMNFSFWRDFLLVHFLLIFFLLCRAPYISKDMTTFTSHGVESICLEKLRLQMHKITLGKVFFKTEFLNFTKIWS